ncbi:MAG: DUF177 domain-containing protein [Proteobacteria bacterium]|nr:DUF177 domain-containing protein [Pseudomonadota bacterium]
MGDRNQPWSFPVRIDEVPGTGRAIDLIADEAVRAATAQFAGLRAVDRFEAHFELEPDAADGLRVRGRVFASIGQTCVVTLEPIISEVLEDVDLRCIRVLPAAVPGARLPDLDGGLGAEEPPMALADGAVDLGAIATEFLLIGIEPYPRKPNAEFAFRAPASAAEGPFAVLARLKSDPLKR